MSTVPEVHHREGLVPAWWVDSNDDVVHGSLLFRVGAADETLVSRGITRLAMQLALTEHPQIEASVVVSAAISSLHVAGSAREVAGALEVISRSLASPSLDRVEEAREAVVEESLWTPIGIEGLTTSLYYGATGYGLIGYDNYGVTEATAEQLHDWSARYFGAGNAAVALTCTPRGLSLHLAPGALSPPPPPIPLALPAPRYDTASGSPWASMGVVGPRDLASSAAMRAVAGRCRLSAERRQSIGRAVSFDSFGPYPQLLDGRTDVNVLRYGAGPEHATSTILAELVEGFAQDGPSTHELHDMAATMRVELSDTARAAGLANAAATDALLGVTRPTAREAPGLVHDLDPEVVRRRWCELSATAVWMIPDDDEAPAVCGPSLAELAYVPLLGRRFEPREPELTTDVITLTDEAIARTSLPGGGTVIAFDQVAALVRLQDSTLLIYGNNGDLIYLEPNDWIDGDTLAAEARRHIPAQVQIRSRIPQPAPFEAEPDDEPTPR